MDGLVTKVEGSRSAGPAAIRKEAKSGSGFADALRTEPVAPAAQAGAPAPLTGIEGLLALQQIDDGSTDRRAASRADEILDRLDDLRHGMLLGRIPPDRLGQLARLARDAQRRASDPKLAEILGEIELRAEVELAKLQQDGIS